MSFKGIESFVQRLFEESFFHFIVIKAKGDVADGTVFGISHRLVKFRMIKHIIKQF